MRNDSPPAARDRFVEPNSADFADAVGVRVSVTVAGVAAQFTEEGPGRAYANVAGVELLALTDGSDTQFVGATTPNGDELVMELTHEAACPGVATLRLERRGEGVAIESVDVQGGRQSLLALASPWAYDSTGRALPTRLEVDGLVVRQIVDTRGAEGRVTFDPTYSVAFCAGYFADANVHTYLDMSTQDIPHCPVRFMFFREGAYDPVFAYDATIANDYGKVLVRQSGECSYSPDTGYAWDFQVPCKAHDFCYDLRRAGFSGTVTDQACDDTFWHLMEANCNDRGSLANDCRGFRDTFYAAVRHSAVVADPSPEPVTVWVDHSSQCMDVEASSSFNNARVLQYFCNWTSNQTFTMNPAPGNPGYFEIKATHSGKCVDAFTTPVIQFSCGYSEQVFQIRGAFNQDKYTLRTKFTGNSKCLDVPYSSLTPGQQLTTYWCNETPNQIWYIF